jgi:hypothetical protein
MLGLASACFVAAADAPTARAAAGHQDMLVTSSPASPPAIRLPDTGAPAPSPIRLATHLVTGTYSNGTPYQGGTSTGTGSTSGSSTGSTSGSYTGSTGGKSLSLPRVAGKPWSSGAGCYSSGFDNWRGRPSDVYTHWAGQDWSTAISSIGWLRKYASMPGRLSLGLPLVEKSTKGRFDLCNNGTFDSKIREVGRRLQAYGLGDSVLRPGWEMNGKGFPWAVEPANKESYKQCFRRVVDILRSQAPKVLIEWNPQKGSNQPYDVRDIYPGNAYVDIIGVDYYDGWIATNDQASWDTMYKKTLYNGPNGLGTWLAFAQSQGKLLAFPEWGIANGYGDPNATDNPFYIQKMHEFFQANASRVAYETYFNCRGSAHVIYPSSYNPKASAKYNQLW